MCAALYVIYPFYDLASEKHKDLLNKSDEPNGLESGVACLREK